MRVRWALLHSCDRSCSYCPEPQTPENSVILPERLISMACRVLELPRSFYEFTFTGGEPTLHPHLPDIIAYIRASGRPAAINLETHGLRDLEYYERLLALMPRGRLRLVITAHPALAGYESILRLMAAAHAAGQNVAIKLAQDPEHKTRCASFLRAFCQIRLHIPFAFEILRLHESHSHKPDHRYTHQDAAWSNAAASAFARAAQAGPAAQNPWPQPAQPYIVDANGKHFPQTEQQDCASLFCWHGLDFFRIDSDGRCYGSLCPQSVGSLPLWQAKRGALLNAAWLAQCRGGACLDQTAKFRTLEQALGYRATYDVICSRLAWPPLGDPRSPEPDATQRVASRLQRLALPADSAEIFIGEPQPDLIPTHLKDIAAIWTRLAAADDRQLFLLCIKALASGNAAWVHSHAGPEPDLPPLAPDALPFSAPGRYCDYIAIDATAKPDFDRYIGAIRQHQPRIAINPGWPQLLPSLLWLAKIAPRHQLRLLWQDSSLSLHALPAAKTGAPARTWPLHLAGLADISIIIATRDAAGHLARCLDAILVQNAPRLDIIIADADSADTTPEIAASYARRFPASIRILRLPRASSLACARNAALTLARGRCLTFLDASDILMPGFLNIDAADADIIACPRLWHAGSHYTGADAPAGVYAGLASLQLLLSPVLPELPFLCLFSASFLRSARLRFASAPFSLLRFAIAAFFYSAKTQVSPMPGCISAIAARRRTAEDFAAFADFLRNFNLDHDLSQNHAFYDACLSKLYTAHKPALFAAATTLPESAVISLSQPRPLLRLLISDCLPRPHTPHTPAIPAIAPEDTDWQAAAARSQPAPELTTIRDAPPGLPVLSVIAPNYNKAAYIGASMRSILSQSFRDFELIVVDDASTDDSFEELCDYADLDARIRLFRMRQNCRQGICRNLGLELARGEFAIFADSDDICLPGYFAAAVAAMREEKADLAIFASQILNAEGEAWTRHAPTGRLNAKQALAAFFRDEIGPEPWAKIYRVNALRAGACSFPPYVYHQDVPFCLAALRACQKIICRDILVYQRVYSRDSAIRPASATYQHIHSALVFYDFVDKTLAEIADKNLRTLDEGLPPFIRWNLENVLLPKLAAFMQAGAGLPFTSQDWRLVTGNASLMRHLLARAARVYAENAAEKAKNTQPVQNNLPGWRPVGGQEPLLAIILEIAEADDPEKWFAALAEQTLPDYELLLIIADACAAETRLVCQRYAAHDGRIRLIANRRNAGASRLAALAAAKSRYVLFAREHDFSRPDALLSTLASLALAPRADFIQLMPQINGAAEPRICSGQDLLASLAARPELFRQPRIWRRECIAALFMPDFAFCDAPVLLSACLLASQVILAPGPGAGAKTADVRMDRRRMAECFAALAWVEAFCVAELRADAELARRLIAGVFSSAQGGLLAYLAQCARRGIDPFREAELAAMRAAQEAMLLMLDNAARAWASQTGFAEELSRRPAVDAGLLALAGSAPAGRPLISVIVLAHNAAAALQGCLESLAAQTAANFEILLVDRCSQDATLNICLENYARFAHCRVLQASRPGAFVFAEIVARMRGDYALFLSGREILPPAFLLELGVDLQGYAPDAASLPARGEATAVAGRQNAPQAAKACLAGQTGAVVLARELAQRLASGGCLAQLAQTGMLALGACLLSCQPARLTVELPPRADAYEAQPLYADSLAQWTSAAHVVLGAASDTGDLELMRACVDWLLSRPGGFGRNVLGCIAAGAREGIAVDLSGLARLAENDAWLRRFALELAVLAKSGGAG